MTPQRLSTEYQPGLVDASRSALLEISISLRKFRESIVLVGGWAPFFLIEEFGRKGITHVGSIDIDLAVDPDSIDEDSYASIVDRIQDRGYRQRIDRNGSPILFSYQRPISGPDGVEKNIQVDFLTSRDLLSGKHRHRLVQGDLRARVCEECEVVFKHNIRKRIDGILPGDGEAVTEILVADIPGSLGMKGIVLGDRYKEKDAYDIFSIVNGCLNSPSEVGDLVRDEMGDAYIRKGIEMIVDRFSGIRSSGPSWVAKFMEPVDATARQRRIAEVHIKMKEFIDHVHAK